MLRYRPISPFSRGQTRALFHHDGDLSLAALTLHSSLGLVWPGMAELPSTWHLYTFNNCRCHPCKAAMRLCSSTVQLELHPQQTFRWLEWVDVQANRASSSSSSRPMTSQGALLRRSFPPVCCTVRTVWPDHDVVGLQGQSASAEKNQHSETFYRIRVHEETLLDLLLQSTPYTHSLTHSLHSTLSVMCGYEHTVPVFLQ